MIFFLYIFLMVSSVYGQNLTDSEPQKCGPNEVYTTCTTSCPSRCPGKDGRPPFPCEPRPFCVAGCQCQPGFVRNADFICIPPEKCPPFECSDPNEKYSNETQSCVCKPGLVRNSENICVILDKGFEVCLENNTEFTLCSSACPKTCANWNTSVVCTRQCVAGCFCRHGFVLNQNQECVLIEKCGEQCKLNEVYSSCGSCDGSCRNPYPICTAVCRVGCFCKPDYVREDVSGRCIPRNECPADLTT